MATMSETCYVLAPALETSLAASAVVSAASAQSSASKNHLQAFGFAFTWPFLPQGPSPARPEQTVRRRLVSASAVSAASVATAPTLVPPPQLQTKLRTAFSSITSSLHSWPAITLFFFKALHSALAKNLLVLGFRTALVVLACEGLACLVSLALAARLPPGLWFMVAALAFIGVLAARSIDHDSAHIRSRKSTTNLLATRQSRRDGERR